MSGYLEEKRERDGAVITWQTPNRQRWWGLVAAILPTGMMLHATRNIEKVNMTEVIAASVLLLGALMVATYTVRFQLNLRLKTFEAVRGFLPAFFWGERGTCQDAFQCVALRKEEMLDAKRHENDPDADSFDQYRVFMVWKNPRREAMLIDTEPGDYEESRLGGDFRGKARQRAREISEKLGIDMLDQTLDTAVVEAESPGVLDRSPSS